MSEIEEYLQQVTQAFKPPIMPIERFLLAHGKPHTAAQRPRWVRQGLPRLCFNNAAVLAKRGRVQYCEGLATPPGLFPMLHAWCIDKGLVVDPTWEKPEECQYFGIIVPFSQVSAWHKKHKFYGVLDTPRGPNFEFMQEWENAYGSPDTVLSPQTNQGGDQSPRRW